MGILTIGTKQLIEAALSMLDAELDEPLPLRFADDRRALAPEVEVRLERIAELLTTKLDGETSSGGAAATSSPPASRCSPARCTACSNSTR